MMDRSTRVVAKHIVHLAAEDTGRSAYNVLKLTGVQVAIIGAWLVDQILL